MELALMIGLQGTGKSTFARARFTEDYVYVSRDLLRNNRHPSQRQLQLIEEALRAGHSVVVDNTHATIADRAPMLTLGHRYSTRVVGYYFPPKVAESRTRNRLRTGAASVPDVAIYATAKRFQPPTTDEGYDALNKVRTLGAAEAPAFEVEPYPEG